MGKEFEIGVPDFHIIGSHQGSNTNRLNAITEERYDKQWQNLHLKVSEKML